MFAFWHVLYQLAIYSSTLWTDTTGLLHQLVICGNTLWTDPTGLLHQLTIYGGMLWTYTGSLHQLTIQQYTLHWHKVCCTSSPFMALHPELTQQVCCTRSPFTAVHSELTQSLLHQVATYSSIHCSDTMPAAQAGNLWQYTELIQQVCCSNWSYTSVHATLT
jgi:hypothetical protein